MSQIKHLSDKEIRLLVQPYLQKWMKVFSTPINREQAATTVSALYQQIGHAPPKVVFLDSPLAIMIATAALFKGSKAAQQRLHEELLAQRNQYKQQLFRALYNQASDSPSCWSLLSGKLANDLFDKRVRETEEELDPLDYMHRRYGSTELETTSALLPDLFSIASGDRNKDWCNNTYSQQQFERLNDRLNHQLGVSLDLPQARIAFDSAAVMPIGSTHIPEAAVYDFVASIGFQADAEPFTLFINSALHLGYISPFREVCFVSDRPQFKRDSQGRLHAIGEPAIHFPDGFGLATFYNGIRLPHRYGKLPPSQWQAQWILEEQNAQIRQILIQEIGYARVCQELQLEELDSWREYTLLKLPIYDDFGPSVTWRATFQRADEEAGATFLLKMTCPSTGLVYALRVPPNVGSAREAATWINWGTDPERFTIET